MPLKPDGDCHDLQARTGRRAKLAPSRRSQPIAKAGHWDKVHRRHPRRQPTATSRLTPPSPRFGYSSPATPHTPRPAINYRESGLVLRPFPDIRPGGSRMELMRHVSESETTYQVPNVDFAMPP